MQKLDFVAIDVETANPDMGTICQIGIAKFASGELVDEWSTLIDPEDYFDDLNISIHGIDSRRVKGKPKLPEIAEILRSYMESNVTVCHTHFDRISISQAFQKYNLEPITTSWLDSARVVRRTWKDLARTGYGLKNVCEKLGYGFKQHDALEDAKAAGFIILAAIQASQINLNEWLIRVEKPIDPTRESKGKAIHRDGNPEGNLFGEVIVFTGALELPRTEVADMASLAGCEVEPNVTKHTSILVVGDQDIRRLAGHEKSLKHRKAEELFAKGQHIRIICESDFKQLVLIYPSLDKSKASKL